MAVASCASSVVACATAPVADPTRRVVAMLLPLSSAVSPIILPVPAKPMPRSRRHETNSGISDRA